MSSNAVKVVCFDLGGVLVNINHTWNAAAKSAGVVVRPDLPQNFRLTDFKPLDGQNANGLDFDDYLSALGATLGIGLKDAAKVHAAIIVGEFVGALGFVRQLQEIGFGLGCLSNTNASHWEVLLDTNRFPALALLNVRLASHLIGVNKPNAAAYAAFMVALKNVGVVCSPEEIVFFDDLEENILAAQQFGWKAHQVNPNNSIAEMRKFLNVF